MGVGSAAAAGVELALRVGWMAAWGPEGATGSAAGLTGRVAVWLAGRTALRRPGVRVVPEGFFAMGIALTLAVADPRVPLGIRVRRRGC